MAYRNRLTERNVWFRGVKGSTRKRKRGGKKGIIRRRGRGGIYYAKTYVELKEEDIWEE